MDVKNIALLGDGGWGTALACLLTENGRQATLWGYFSEITGEIRRLRENRRFLPGIRIPEAVRLTNDLTEAVGGAEMIVFSTPVLHLRSVAEAAAPILKKARGARVMSVAKGIERGTLLRGSEILQQVLGVAEVGVLSGPSHAEEVARGLPASVVAAAGDEAFAVAIQRAFMNDRFRVYTSGDVVGVEIGAAAKNVIAIAAGLCDGLGFGDNTKAALLTRGLAEIARLGTAMGARRETFFGLSGLGDLITTCVSPYGRNLKVGREMGKGKKLEEVLHEIAPMVPEGVWTTRAVCELAERYRVEMPISRAVRAVLFEERPPFLAAQELMTRDPKAE